MISQAFLDESGGEDTRTFILGGYVGSVELWETFSDDWDAALLAHGKQTFHMVEWEGERIAKGLVGGADDHLSLDLVAVIAKHRPLPVWVRIDSAAWKEIVVARFPDRRAMWREGIDHTLMYQYCYAAMILIQRLLDLEEFVGVPLGRMETFFDWQRQFHARIRHIVDYSFSSWLFTAKPQLMSRLATPHWPRTDERPNYVPLQAADLLDWHLRRTCDYADGVARPVYQALKAAMHKPAEIPIGRLEILKDAYSEGAPLARLLREWGPGAP